MCVYIGKYVDSGRGIDLVLFNSSWVYMCIFICRYEPIVGEMILPFSAPLGYIYMYTLICIHMCVDSICI